MDAVASRIQLGAMKRALSNVDEDIVIGKDVLELFAGAMYADPMSVYREYVQNAADAIDEAREVGLTSNRSEDISIAFDHAERTVRIRDLGIGVQSGQFTKRLTAIGASLKRGTSARGFRGIGRLSGLGYCQELVFRSRASGDPKVKEMRWDGRVLRERLRDTSFKGSLTDLIREVAQVSELPGAEYPAHFFEVELRKLLRVKNDMLLNEEAVRAYLSQVAPVPFDPDFSFGLQIQEFLSAHGVPDPVRIVLSDGLGLVYHRARDSFLTSPKVTDHFRSIDFFEHRNSDNELLSFGWLLDHTYAGTISRKLGLAGIRLRHRNVQVGDDVLIASLYPETRFALWAVGDIHVAHPRVIPNGRRDDFEHSPSHAQLLEELRQLTKQITQTIRERSDQRTKLKKIHFQLTYATSWLEHAPSSKSPAVEVAMVDRARNHVAEARKALGKLADNIPAKEIALKVIERTSAQVEDQARKHRPGALNPVHYAAVSAILSSSSRPEAVTTLAEQVIAAMKKAAKA